VTVMSTLKRLLPPEAKTAKVAWFKNGESGKPELARCPYCQNEKRKKRAVLDVIQFGFEWDDHMTVFRCSCGGFFFTEYKIWHVGEDK
jgi:hypothetical protein